MKKTVKLLFTRICRASSSTSGESQTYRRRCEAASAVTVLAAVLLWLFAVRSFAVDETLNNGDGQEAIEKHGPVQILAENLLRVREQERLLQSL